MQSEIQTATPALPPVSVETSDTSFAAALMSHGGILRHWERRDGRVWWRVDGVRPEWVDAYKNGEDGYQRYSKNRRMLCDMASTIHAAETK